MTRLGLRLDSRTLLEALPLPPAQRVTVGRVVVESRGEMADGRPPSPHPAGPEGPGGMGLPVIRVPIRKGIFGLADHLSTQLLLSALQEHLSPGDRVLDIGTGTGVLAMAAAILGAHEVVAVDKHHGSAELARRAVDDNRLGEMVRVVHGTAREVPGLFDLVLANVGGGVLLQERRTIEAALRNGGLLLATVTESEPEAVAARLSHFALVTTMDTVVADVEILDEAAHGFRPDPDNGWLALVLRHLRDPEPLGPPVQTIR